MRIGTEWRILSKDMKQWNDKKITSQIPLMLIK